MRCTFLCALFVTAAGMVSVASAQTKIIDLSTGLDGSNRVFPSGGEKDAHWTVESGEKRTFVPAVTVDTSNPDWLQGWPSNNANSKWIARTTDFRQGSPSPPYKFRRTFDLTGHDLSSVTITGSWAIDDEGTLSLNGHRIAVLSPWPWVGWPQLQQFSVPKGSSFLNQGENVLTISIDRADNQQDGVRLEGYVSCAGESSARPSTEKHVRELARYLDNLKIAEPVTYRQLSVYPILVEDVPLLRGRWLTLDKAIARGILEVREKPGGSVPVVRVGNRSRDENVLIMTGEVIAGGMQTRTIRHDVVLAPGQMIDLGVFCVEAHRWAGEGKFSGGSKTMLPQSIQGELRKGADQSKVWSEVARNNSSLKAENATGSLEAALSSPHVRKKLEDVRRKIVPQIPSGTVGFIFVDHGRALGAEFFGSENLARELLPKLLDSYAVDYVILRDSGSDRDGKSDNRVAIDFFEQVCRAGSQRAATPGSGSGISTRQGGLLGDGVSLDDTPVHYGVQFGERNEPKPNQRRRPLIIYP